MSRTAAAAWKNRNRSELILAAGLAALLVAALALWQREAGGPSGAASGREIGTITFRYKRAQRRAPDQAAFFDVSQKDPVYNGDVIRTSTESEATVTFPDGSSLVLDQLSMIVLEEKNGATRLKFVRGTLRFRAGPNAAGRPLITAAGKTIEPKGLLRLTDRSPDGATGTALVLEGAATVRSEKETLELGSGQFTRLGEGEPLRARSEPLIATFPPDGLRVFLKEATAEVVFEWRRRDSAGPPPEDVSLRLARDPLFRRELPAESRGAGRPEVRDERARTRRRLGPGFYYWQLLASPSAKGGPRALTAVRKLWLVSVPAVRLVRPAPRAVLRGGREPPLVVFRWRTHPFANDYEVLIADEPTFAKPLAREIRPAGNLALRLKNGSYYWKVRTRPRFEGSGAESAAHTFRVARARGGGPGLRQPVAGADLVRTVLLDRGYLFSWAASGDAVQHVLRVMAPEGTADSKRVLLSRRVATNFATISGSLPAGTYEWQVESRLAGGGRLRSKRRRFSVVERSALKLLLPQADEALYVGRFDSEPLVFSWEAVRAASRFRVSYRRAGPDSTPVWREGLRAPFARVGKLAPGDYLWKVQAIDSDGRIVSESKERKLRVLALAAPRAVFPRPGAVVDMSTRDALAFRWSPVDGARKYELAAFTIAQRGRMSELFRVRLARTSFRFTRLKKLRLGRHAWRVSAIDGPRVARSRLMPFSITLEQPKAPEVIAPETGVP